MKNLFLLIAMMCAVSISFAQKHTRSILKIRMSDDSRLTVSIDGRYYNKYGRSLTMGDLPGGSHYLKIYKYIPYQDEPGGQARTVYSGNIRLKAGYVVSLVCDPRTGRLRINSHPIGGGSMEEYEDYNETEDTRSSKDDIYDKGSLSRADMENLQSRVADRIGDTDKEKLMQTVLTDRNYTTEQVRVMLGWLGFESSRLDFVKWAYNGVSDKQNYWKLDSEFQFSGSKDEFTKFLDTKK